MTTHELAAKLLAQKDVLVAIPVLYKFDIHFNYEPVESLNIMPDVFGTENCFLEGNSRKKEKHIDIKYMPD